MTVVKSLVQEGVTMCATIHSPSPYTFALFDRLLGSVCITVRTDRRWDNNWLRAPCGA